MGDFFRLRNPVKHYEWGSRDWIPRLMGIVPDGKPWAELWMGSHNSSPSTVNVEGREISLGELCGGELPFLFKLLAAEKPLSIQAHPNIAQARQGFARENGANIPLDAPERNYRDPNHKPEIICALTPFTGLCGFREPGEIRRLLGDFLLPLPQNAPLRRAFAPLLAALEPGAAEQGRQAEALRGFFSALFALDSEIVKELSGYVLSLAREGKGAEKTAGEGGLSPLIRNLMEQFAGLYPEDPALIAPLYLNLITLNSGEAVFLRAGVLHAYLHGLGVELMANSDNVLRGGLTAKHVDVPELMRVLDFRPARPEILRPVAVPEAAPPSPARLYYPSYCDEFSLSVLRGGGGEISFVEQGPAICIVTEGSMRISGGGEDTVFKTGESVFITPRGPGKEPLRFCGDFILYAAALAANKGQAGENPG